MSQSLRFREIDLERDAESCIRFRADSFVESFGSATDFYRAAGEGAKDYLDGLGSKNREWPGSCVRAWLGDTIAGQIEVRGDRTDPSRAHVLLYYLRSDLRGRDLGEELDAYVRDLCRAAGVHTTTLRVNPEQSGNGLHPTTAFHTCLIALRSIKAQCDYMPPAYGPGLTSVAPSGARSRSYGVPKFDLAVAIASIDRRAFVASTRSQ